MLDLTLFKGYKVVFFLNSNAEFDCVTKDYPKEIQGSGGLWCWQASAREQPLRREGEEVIILIFPSYKFPETLDLSNYIKL